MKQHCSITLSSNECILVMNTIDTNQIELPGAWKAISNDHEVMKLGKAINRFVADSPSEELERELCEGHCLYGVECRAIACNTRTMKDFLFVTDNMEKPFALVHLTFIVESITTCPHTTQFSCLEEFMRHEKYLDNQTDEEIILKARALRARELLKKEWRDK